MISKKKGFSRVRFPRLSLTHKHKTHRKAVFLMYRIEYENPLYFCDFAENRTKLLSILKSNTKHIVDIKKLYVSGVSDSVIEKYRKYLGQP